MRNVDTYLRRPVLLPGKHSRVMNPAGDEWCPIRPINAAGAQADAPTCGAGCVRHETRIRDMPVISVREVTTPAEVGVRRVQCRTPTDALVRTEAHGRVHDDFITTTATALPILPHGAALTCTATTLTGARRNRPTTTTVEIPWTKTRYADQPVRNFHGVRPCFCVRVRKQVNVR